MRKEKETDALAKILRRTIIPVLAVMLTASSLWAQSNGLGREVSLSGTHITLGKTITEIQTQTKYRFAYNPDQIDTVATVVFPRHAMTLQMALDVLTAKGKYQYVVRNNFIALSPGEQLAQGANAAERTSTPDDYKIAGLDNRNSVPVEPAGLEIKTTETPTPDTVVRNAPSSNLVLEEVIATVEAMTDEPSFVALKTNILYDATATINLGVEFRTGRRTSVDVSGNWNPFTFCNNRKWKHVLIQPEFRWWTKETFSGHFLGLHAHYAYYNVGNLPKPFSSNLRDHRFEGWLAGVGMSYGYRWNFTPNWGLEATVGVGYARMSYDKYNCERIHVTDKADPTSVGTRSRRYYGCRILCGSRLYRSGSVAGNVQEGRRSYRFLCKEKQQV